MQIGPAVLRQAYQQLADYHTGGRSCAVIEWTRLRHLSANLDTALKMWPRPRNSTRGARRLMNTNDRLSGARVTTVIGLLAGAVGIVILRLAGTPMPLVPPGLVLLIAAALLVALQRWRWAPAVGALVGLAEIIGFVASGSWIGLANIDQIWILVGTWIRGLGIVTAVLAGIVATATKSVGDAAASESARSSRS
jgi:hypothetical protein